MWGGKEPLKAKNSNLHKAKESKNDEFYTQLSDIEKEVIKYKEHLRGKTIYCNCDDPAWSNFVRYFIMQFNFFGLKRLIATGYTSGNGALTNQLDLVDLMQLEDPFQECENNTKKSYYIDINSVSQKLSDYFTDNAEKNLSNYDLLKNLKEEGFIKELNGSGDFRSNECINLLQQSDVVITNPPFSLFREFVNLLFKYNKKFIILGNQNAITYKEFFPLIKDNKVWLGASIHSGDREFEVPFDYPIKTLGYRIDNEGKKYIRVKGVRWWTNLDYKERYKDLVLYKKYTSEEYPHYDNYNAINVNETSKIPIDYKGIMGVPITFLDKYNPQQFKLLGIMNTGELNPGIRYPNTPHGRPLINGKELYLRILIVPKE